MEKQNSVFLEFFDFLKQKANSHFVGKSMTIGQYFIDENGEEAFVEVIGNVVACKINNSGRVDLIISYKHPFLHNAMNCTKSVWWSTT